ncbi:MAG: hypothetical protein AAGF98_00350 [Cyanobacteria bacterium P01_H01_bin.153]
MQLSTATRSPVLRLPYLAVAKSAINRQIIGQMWRQVNRQVIRQVWRQVNRQVWRQLLASFLSGWQSG